VPLCTGEDGSGLAYLGVVSFFSPPLVLVVFAVLPALELEDDELELLDDPQPAASTSAEQAIRTGRPLLIGRSFLRTLGEF
jgi:hypothetical protein